jgi:hypothetical protein
VAGILKVPTGWLIACDPTRAMFPHDFPPLTCRFPPGDWPVEVYRVVHSSEGAADTHLAATVRTGTEPVERWEHAVAFRPMLRIAGSSNKDETQKPWLVLVDGGVAAFVDKAGMNALGEAADLAMNNYDRDGPFFISLVRTSIVELDCEPAANVVIFGAGVGDGAYPCFIGYSAASRPVALLMLFDTFDPDATAAATGGVDD